MSPLYLLIIVFPTFDPLTAQSKQIKNLAIHGPLINENFQSKLAPTFSRVRVFRNCFEALLVQM
jgi:hypothetical protein